MKRAKYLLADHPGLGQIRACVCGAIHVNVGAVTLNLEPIAFLQLTTLMDKAADSLLEKWESCKDAEVHSQMLGVPQNRFTH